MLDEERLRRILPISGFGDPLSYFQEVGSTNDIAMDLAEQGAPHGSLILAETQTAGRGQRGRKWITAAGSGLAMSVILRPTSMAQNVWVRLHALGALAVVEALGQYGLKAKVKWPNDVLLKGRKVAGILVETSWEGEQIEYSILGIGVNVTPESVPDAQLLDYPAVSIEEVLGKQLDWCELITEILRELSEWCNQINRSNFIKRWEEKLAYRGRKVLIDRPEGEITGILLGLNEQGALKVRGDKGVVEVGFIEGQVHLMEG